MDQLENAKTLRQGLAAGDIGVVTARAGVGKSACLVQLGLAELFDGKAVLHVSLENPVEHVRRWYDAQIARMQGGPRPTSDDRWLQIERLRHILCYQDGSFTPERLRSSLAFLAEHMAFAPHLVLIDGLAIPGDDEDLVERLATMAAETGIEVWLSALRRRSDCESATSDDAELPPPLQGFAKWITTFVCLEPDGAEVGIRRWSRAERRWTRLPLRLDPPTLWIVSA